MAVYEPYAIHMNTRPWRNNAASGTFCAATRSIYLGTEFALLYEPYILTEARDCETS